MNTKNKRDSSGRYFQIGSIILCLLLQISCSPPPPAGPLALHEDLPCPTSEVRDRLREYFSSQAIRTDETTSPDGKSFTITTGLVKEQRSGNVERQVAYKLEIKPADNPTKSRVGIIRADVRSKGTREREWQNEFIGDEPEHEQQIQQVLRTICRSAQQ